MRRIERLINLIAALLESDRAMTAAEIRTNIAGYDQSSDEAFRRAFERDKADLKAIGIPLEMIEDEWGDPPTYTIPKERYYLPELDLEPDELAALRIAADAILGVGDDAISGISKLSMGAGDALGGGGRLSFNVDLAAAEPRLAQIYEAIRARRRVAFTYRSAGSEGSRERILEPLSLVHRRGQWYLIGRDIDLEEIRTFKVSRIVSGLTLGDEIFDRPDGFDPSEYLAEGRLGAAEVEETAVVRFSERVAWWPRQTMPEKRLRDASEGRVDLELPVSSLDALFSFAMWWGTDVEVIAPPQARNHIAARLQSFLEAT